VIPCQKSTLVNTVNGELADDPKEKETTVIHTPTLCTSDLRWILKCIFFLIVPENKLPFTHQSLESQISIADLYSSMVRFCHFPKDALKRPDQVLWLVSFSWRVWRLSNFKGPISLNALHDLVNCNRLISTQKSKQLWWAASCRQVLNFFKLQGWYHFLALLDQLSKVFFKEFLTDTNSLAVLNETTLTKWATQTFVYVFEIISYYNTASFEIIVYYHNTNLERTTERRSSFIQLWCPLCTSTAYLIDYLPMSKVVKSKMQGKGQLELDNSRNTTCWDFFLYQY
jgi:hypothetical protein